MDGTLGDERRIMKQSADTVSFKCPSMRLAECQPEEAPPYNQCPAPRLYISFDALRRLYGKDICLMPHTVFMARISPV